MSKSEFKPLPYSTPAQAVAAFEAGARHRCARGQAFAHQPIRLRQPVDATRGRSPNVAQRLEVGRGAYDRQVRAEMESSPQQPPTNPGKQGEQQSAPSAAAPTYDHEERPQTPLPIRKPRDRWAGLFDGKGFVESSTGEPSGARDASYDYIESRRPWGAQ